MINFLRRLALLLHYDSEVRSHSESIHEIAIRLLQFVSPHRDVEQSWVYFRDPVMITVRHCCHSKGYFDFPYSDLYILIVFFISL